MGADRPKQFVRVNAIPTLVYSLVAADAVPPITQIVLNYPAGWLDDVRKIIDHYAIKTAVTYGEAGATRHESVRLLLPLCDNEMVLIHESARPLVTPQDFHTLIADERENVSYMLPIPFTVAPVDPKTRTVTGHLDRSRLRNVQLPQKFRRSTLIAAHESVEQSGIQFTEDATLCAVTGAEVFFIDGSERNFKVTTKTDVRLAGYLLSGEAEE